MMANFSFLLSRPRPIGWMVLLILFCSLLWWTAGARPKKAPPQFIGKTCQTSECHSDYGKRGVSIHRPVRFQQCTVCHKQPRANEHIFVPADKSNQACFGCHRSKPGIHKHGEEVKGWDCLSCHQPHQSPQKHLLRKPAQQLCRSCHQSYHRKNTVSAHEPVHQGKCLNCHRPHLPNRRSRLMRRPDHQLCVSCHQKESRQIQAFAHKHPNVQTQCTACHQPHVSPHPKLLRRPGKHLCLHCHKTLHQPVAAQGSFHKPVSEDCTKCHQPHGSQHARILAKPAQEQCISCHKEVVAKHGLTQSAHVSATCLNCHRPHRSKHPKLQRKTEVEQCLSCHNRPIPTKQGRVVADVPAWLKQPYQHKPVQEGKCSQCHQPHHSLHPQLLKKAHASSFYVPYAKQQYELCLSCHKPEMVQTKNTRKFTKFRNGDLNLHYIHVNQVRRGRNCTVCHDVHATRQPALIRDFKSYANGAWQLPIRFTKHPDGGTCVSGCHAEKSYRTTTPLREGYLLHPTPSQPPNPR